MFFINDPIDPRRKVVIIHEPRSRRVFGGDDVPFLVPNGVDMALEIPLSDFSQSIGNHKGALQVVPVLQVEGNDWSIGLPLDDEIFDHTQFVDEHDLEPHGM